MSDEFSKPRHPSRALYLHETIDIVGDGAVPYMEESVVGFDAESIADRGLTLYGTWLVQGSTGRWPQVGPGPRSSLGPGPKCPGQAQAWWAQAYWGVCPAPWPLSILD